MRKHVRVAKLVVIILGFGILIYWYFFAGYFHKHLFYNKYGSKIGEPWGWIEEPFPIMNPDGAVVLVDYARNELAIVLNAPGQEGLIRTGNDTSGVSVGIGRDWVEIPESPNTCVLVEESGTHVIRTLKAGEAKTLFSQLMNKQSGHLRTDIAIVLGIPEATTSTHATSSQ